MVLIFHRRFDIVTCLITILLVALVRCCFRPLLIDPDTKVQFLSIFTQDRIVLASLLQYIIVHSPYPFICQALKTVF